MITRCAIKRKNTSRHHVAQIKLSHSQIRHGHVQKFVGKHTYLRLTLPKSKGHDTPIITMPQAVRAYERLSEIAERRGSAAPEDYLFMPNVVDRDIALLSISRQFKKVLIAAGLDSGAKNRCTLYSLRHTALTFRLQYGEPVDLITLSRNARTSVSMVEKFYSGRLNAETNLANFLGRTRWGWG